LGLALYRGGMDVRELTYFHAVAEELNFSRAAARLGIAQPPLSRAISQLERRLGVRLFDRDTHRVTLTPAGEVLLVEAAHVLDAVAAATHRTQRAGGGLVVTAKPGVASSLLREIVTAYLGQVEVLVSGVGEQVGLVRTGRADAALVGSPHQRADRHGLDTEPLVSEPRVAALPAGHPLAGRPALTVADLARYPMPRWRHTQTDVRDYWTGQYVPVDGPAVSDATQLLEVVALGQAVALIPASLATDNPRQDVTYLPVVDADPYVVSIAWPAGSRDKALAAFVRTAMEVSAERSAAA
jgi:LysR family transcriptional regulator, benzoate and cis,cis-muconate-responsive activator of ben and cat genes